MKEDYLWDKTGEPDPEIQELEQLLGTLRYQPRPLEIPAGLEPGRKSTFLPRFPRLLAIAATIAIMLLGAGLWFGLHRARTGQIAEVENKPGTTGNGPETVPPVLPKIPFTPTPVPPVVPDEKRIRQRVNPGALSREVVAGHRPRLNTPKLTPQELEEAQAAKEQLMLALRVASSKLNFAQKKAQEINTENQTHNQHKVG
jgi:hypothetical protein